MQRVLVDDVAFSGSTVQSVERALAILEVLGEHGHGLSLTDVVEETGLHSATAFRLLGTMAVHGYVRKDPVSKAYRLGFKLLGLAQAARQQMDLSSEVMSDLQRLAAEAKELANLVVPSGLRIVYVAQVNGRTEGVVKMFTQLGARERMYCTAVGKCVLAQFTDHQLARYLEEEELARYTLQTITEKEALIEELQAVRRRGYAIDDEERDLGVRCVASPLFDGTGAVVAAIGVSGPSVRLTPDRLPRLGKLVMSIAESISSRLGYRGGDFC